MLKTSCSYLPRLPNNIIFFFFQSCEEGIVKLRNAQSNPQTPLFYVVNQILYPFVQGCETKDQKIVKVRPKKTNFVECFILNTIYIFRYVWV